jgi:hypothetical protein
MGLFSSYSGIILFVRVKEGAWARLASPTGSFPSKILALYHQASDVGETHGFPPAIVQCVRCVAHVSGRVDCTVVLRAPGLAVGMWTRD